MDFQAYISKIRTFLSYKVFTTLIYCILGLLLFVILFHNVKPETYDIELFSVADKTIRSPKTVEDEIKTSEARENAADQIDKVYVFKKEMAQNRVSLITSIFDFVKDTNYESHKVVDENSSEIKNEEAAITLQTRLKQLKTRLTENVSEDITNSISDQIFMTLLQTEGAELQKNKRYCCSECGICHE